MLATHNRISHVLEGTRAPLPAEPISNRLSGVFDTIEARATPEGTLSSPLHGCGAVLLRSCPLRRLQEPFTHIALFEAYAKSRRVLKAQWAGAERFTEGVCLAAMEWRGAKSQRKDPREKLLAERKGKLPSFAFPGIPPMRGEAALLPAAETFSVMKQELIQNARALIHQMEEGLEALVKSEVIGTITWLGPKVCRYDYFTEEVVDSEKDRKTVGKNHQVQRSSAGNKDVERHTETENVRKTVQRVRRHVRHVHDLIEANVEPFAESNVPLPAKARALVEHCPRWLLPKLGVVTGHQVFEALAAREVRRKKFTEESLVSRTWEVQRVRPDPALVLGPYVLTAWV